jgi:hypothetical protein
MLILKEEEAMNFVRRLSKKRIRNLCQAKVLNTKPFTRACKLLSSRFVTVEYQRHWLCPKHFQMQRDGNLAVVERGEQGFELVDCSHSRGRLVA